MSAELKYWYLHDHKLFRNLSFSEIDGLCILSKFKRSKKNEIIDLPFGEKERVFFLKHGAIKLVKINDDGEEISIDILQKGDIFGELNLEKSGGGEEYFKVVTEEAIICTFFREKLEDVMLQKPDFALNYIKIIGFNFKKIQNSYKNILFKDAKTRLLLLLMMILDKEDASETSFMLPNYLTQKDIAQLICTTRQTVVTLFNELERDGYLHYAHKEILIKDVTRFRNLVENVK
jgi:CRP/FNR family transcriptional regulator, cyclic AMP receptor protein